MGVYLLICLSTTCMPSVQGAQKMVLRITSQASQKNRAVSPAPNGQRTFILARKNFPWPVL